MRAQLSSSFATRRRFFPLRWYARDAEQDIRTGYRMRTNEAEDRTEIVSVAELQGDLLQGRVNRKPWEQSRWRIAQPATGAYWYREGTEAEIEIGEGTRCINTELRCTEGAKLKIGCHAFLGERTIIQAKKLVEIGDGATIGRGALLLDRQHHPLVPWDKETVAPIVVGEHSYVGDYTVVLPGSIIPPGVVIPPCSVITKQSCQRSEPRWPYIRAKNHNRLLAADTERRIRERVAYNQLVSDSFSGSGRGGSLPQYNVFAVTVAGTLANVSFARSVTFYLRPWGPPVLGASPPYHLRVAHNTFVHNSTQILATGGDVTIGQDCMVSWRACVLTQCLDDHGDITLGDGVWVGAMAIILPGTTIGAGSVIGAGAVVQGHFPAFSVIAGHPARVIRTIPRFSGARHSTTDAV